MKVILISDDEKKHLINLEAETEKDFEILKELAEKELVTTSMVDNDNQHVSAVMVILGGPKDPTVSIQRELKYTYKEEEMDEDEIWEFNNVDFLNYLIKETEAGRISWSRKRDYIFVTRIKEGLGYIYLQDDSGFTDSLQKGVDLDLSAANRGISTTNDSRCEITPLLKKLFHLVQKVTSQ